VPCGGREVASELSTPAVVVVRRLGVAVLAAVASAAGCSNGDDGASPGHGYENLAGWVCCLAGDAGPAPPAGWCECASSKEGTAVDCFAQGVPTCPAAPHCVVQGAGDAWNCACAASEADVPTGSDVYPVEHCPP